mmetsp:Transcript_6578/g.11592  ORF Transcript_6578/g.11592 Transcript_6578/m.11592 type:complete len:108 (+) Transcript_6578:3408-3731(+)
MPYLWQDPCISVSSASSTIEKRTAAASDWLRKPEPGTEGSIACGRVHANVKKSDGGWELFEQLSECVVHAQRRCSFGGGDRQLPQTAWSNGRLSPGRLPASQSTSRR